MSDSNVSLIGPPTIEAVMNLLWGVAGRWREIARGLEFDEDHIENEIFTNNSTDEACLQDCVEQWIARLQPSWEKLSHVLRDMGEEELAQKAWSGIIGVEGNVVVNPRRACARVTVVVLCVCLSVCLLPL